MCIRNYRTAQVRLIIPFFAMESLWWRVNEWVGSSCCFSAQNSSWTIGATELYWAATLPNTLAIPPLAILVILAKLEGFTAAVMDIYCLAKITRDVFSRSQSLQSFYWQTISIVNIKVQHRIKKNPKIVMGLSKIELLIIFSNTHFSLQSNSRPHKHNTLLMLRYCCSCWC